MLRARLRHASGTLPRELAKAGITDMPQVNAYLERVYLPRHNAEFAVPAAELGRAFVPYIGNGLADILYEHHDYLSATLQRPYLIIVFHDGGIVISYFETGPSVDRLTWK